MFWAQDLFLQQVEIYRQSTNYREQNTKGGFYSEEDMKKKVSEGGLGLNPFLGLHRLVYKVNTQRLAFGICLVEASCILRRLVGKIIIYCTERPGHTRHSVSLVLHCDSNPHPLSFQSFAFLPERTSTTKTSWNSGWITGPLVFWGPRNLKPSVKGRRLRANRMPLS